MKIAFLSNKLTLRGTEVAIYDYADYNELILKNTSIIITRDINKLAGAQDIHQEAYDKFNKRFPVFYYETIPDIDTIVEREKVDILFIEKAGGYDGILSKKCKNLVHCVFSTIEPHGEMHTSLSDSLNIINKTNCPVIPYMVRVDPCQENLRKQLNIPDNAIVFGTYSGADCFNIDYVRKVVDDIGNNPLYSNIYFIFLNIIPFGKSSPRIMFMPGTSNMMYKRMFINTCDAMIYGRDGGETFGLSCGEYSLCDKPVIARPGERGRNHEDVLGDFMIKHTNYNELHKILTNWSRYNKDVSNNEYKKFSPEYVMGIFDSIVKRM